MSNLISREELAQIASEYAIATRVQDMYTRHASVVAIELGRNIPEEKCWPESKHLEVLINCLLDEMVGKTWEVTRHRREKEKEKLHDKDRFSFNELPPCPQKKQEHLDLDLDLNP